MCKNKLFRVWGIGPIGLSCHIFHLTGDYCSLNVLHTNPFLSAIMYSSRSSVYLSLAGKLACEWAKLLSKIDIVIWYIYSIFTDILVALIGNSVVSRPQGSRGWVQWGSGPDFSCVILDVSK